jgi:hypothetical protein
MDITGEFVGYGVGMSGLGATDTFSDAAGNHGSSVTWWLFIEQIKAYRLRAGLTHADMAGIGLGSQARWNRLENHKSGVKIRPGDVLVMANAFRLTSAEATELEDMRARAEREVDAGIPDVEPTFREYLAFERHATQVDSLGGVHGLIQTPRFAAATAALETDNAAEIQTVVELRQQRQRATLGRALVRAVLDEDVLRRVVESTSIMNELKLHLRGLVEAGLADIRVHPERLGAYSAWRTSTTLLHFGTPDTRRGVVYTETLIGGSHTDRAEVVAKVTSKFAKAFEQAVSIEEYS